MKTKKAQSEIITTVLIILLVLAAVVIVWQVVQGTVKKGGEAITTGSSCMGINVDIEKLNTTDAVVRRGAGGPVDAVTLYVIPTGGNKLESTTTTTELSQVTIHFSTALASKAEVKAGAKLLDGTLCSPTAVEIVP